MADNNAEVYPDEKTNPMPQSDSKRRGAAAVKSLIGIFALADMLFFCLSAHYNKQKDHSGGEESSSGSMESLSGSEESSSRGAGGGTSVKPTVDRRVLLFDGISIGITVIDFGLSCIVGYGIYSPMDASSFDDKSSGYPKLIDETSKACGNYTHLWFMKTAIAVVLPITSVLLAYRRKNEAKEIFDIVNASLGGVAAVVSVGMESIALDESRKVEDSKLTECQKRDKRAFQAETSAFIIDDIRGILDAIITGFDTQHKGLLIAREIVAFGYACGMFAEAGIIDGSW